jgi:hypothetical protein
VLTVVADSEDFYRSSEVQLDGDRAPRTINVEFRNMPGGEYKVSGTLTDWTGQSRDVVQQTARVLSISDR